MNMIATAVLETINTNKLKIQVYHQNNSIWKMLKILGVSRTQNFNNLLLGEMLNYAFSKVSENLRFLLFSLYIWRSFVLNLRRSSCTKYKIVAMI